MSRYPSQNQVMSRKSATEEIAIFLKEHQDILTEDFIKILKRSINASMGCNFRMEWLHAISFCLSSLGSNPQHSSNLGAAPKWANTEMMMLELLAKWFALNNPDVIISIKPLFEMLLNSAIIKRIFFEVEIQHNLRYVKLFQNINPLAKYPAFRPAVDIAQATFIADQLLNNIFPESAEEIAYERLRHKITSSNRYFSFRNNLNNNAKSHLAYNKCVVEISANTLEYDYSMPWRAPLLAKGVGSGFILKYKNKKFIVSNAHVVTDSSYLKLRLSNCHKYYPAKILQISHASDLALLSVEDDDFWNSVSCFELGEDLGLEDQLKVIGFPMGGNELAVTSGKVSRVEVGEYTHSGLNLLHYQVDAAINPGNSGGPVIYNNKVVGVAFQGISEASLVGYIIPGIILRHFLDDYLLYDYKGFPILDLAWQKLNNYNLREQLGLKDYEGGIRITRVPADSSAAGSLKEGDILLEIDNISIKYDGTISLDAKLGDRISFFHLISRKFVGETIDVKILRRGKLLTEKIVLNNSHEIDSTIDNYQHNSFPRFYINSLLVFTPLTKNYLNDLASEDHDLASGDHKQVVIASVLPSKYTSEYMCHKSSVVDTVNKIKIKDFKHLVDILNKNEQQGCTIELISGELIYIPKISELEHDEIMKKHGIDRICDNETARILKVSRNKKIVKKS